VLTFALFAVLLIGLQYKIATISDEYRVAKEFIALDSKIASSIGKVQHVEFRFWDGFDSVSGSDGHANYTFDATTSQGKFTVDVHLRFERGAWNVASVEVRGPTGEQVHI
jgi:hypothetical protein